MDSSCHRQTAAQNAAAQLQQTEGQRQQTEQQLRAATEARGKAAQAAQAAGGGDGGAGGLQEGWQAVNDPSGTYYYNAASGQAQALTIEAF